MPYLPTPVSGFSLKFSSFLFCVSFFPRPRRSHQCHHERFSGDCRGERPFGSCPALTVPTRRWAGWQRRCGSRCARDSVAPVAVPEFSLHQVGPRQKSAGEVRAARSPWGTRGERVAVSSRALPLPQAPPTGDLAPTKGDTNPRVGGGGGPGLGAERIKVPRARLPLGFLLPALRLLATCWLRSAASLGYFV